MKMKKKYWIYLILILFIASLVWMFTRSAVADNCSMQLNACLLKAKTQAFFPRMWSGIVCTVNNFGCLIGRLF